MTNIFTINEVCESLEDGNWIESKDQSKDGIRLIQTGNIKSGYFEDNPHKARYISEKTFNKLNCKEVFEGDILISRLPDPVGRGCILPKLENRSITAVDCAIVRVKKNIINNKYLLYFLQSPQYQFQVNQKVTGTTRSRISRKNLGEINIPVPSLQEQETIVERLDKVFENNFEYINNISSKLVELEKLEKRFIKKMFDDEKCESFKLGNFFEITSSKRVFKNEWKDKGVPFLRARELVKLANNLEFKDPIYISNSHYEQIKNKYGIPKIGDILITGVGTLGITYLVNSSKKFYFKDGNIIWLKNLNKVNSDYIKSYIDSPDFQDKINKKIGATVKTFTISDAKNFEVPIPSEEKQKIIYEKIQEFKNIKNDLKNSYEHNINKLKLLKKSILNKEFSYE